MATNETLINIPGRLHSVASEGNVAGADEIYDDTKGKKQNVINQETDEALDNRYTKDQTYSKSELNSMITTPNQKYVTVAATDQTTDVTDVLPATGEADTIYRVGNWDGSSYDITVYSEYAWKGDAYVHLNTKTQIGEVFDISAYHATGGTLATYADLEAALGVDGSNVPAEIRRGGMSVKFVCSSDNKYVQYRLMLSEFTADQFINTANWQGVDDEPTAGSDNLVKSGGVARLEDGYPFKTNLNNSNIKSILDVWLDLDFTTISDVWLKYFFNLRPAVTPNNNVTFTIKYKDNSTEDLVADLTGKSTIQLTGIQKHDLKIGGNIVGYVIVDWDKAPNTGFYGNTTTQYVPLNLYAIYKTKTVSTFGPRTDLAASQKLAKDLKDNIDSNATKYKTALLAIFDNIPSSSSELINGIKSIIITKEEFVNGYIYLKYFFNREPRPGSSTRTNVTFAFVPDNGGEEILFTVDRIGDVNYNYIETYDLRLNNNLSEVVGKITIDWSYGEGNAFYGNTTDKCVKLKNSYLQFNARAAEMVYSKKLNLSNAGNMGGIIDAIGYAYVNCYTYEQMYKRRYFITSYSNLQGTTPFIKISYIDSTDKLNESTTIAIINNPSDYIECGNIEIGRVVLYIDWNSVTGTASGRLELLDKRFTNQKPSQADYVIKDTKATKISVSKYNSTKYNSIAAAVNSITDASYDHQYEIVVYPGTYYEHGIHLPDFVHLHGIHPDRTIITNEGVSTEGDYLIDAQGYCKISNLVLVSVRGSACIHFDHVNLAGKTMTVENVVLRKNTSTAENINAGGSAFADGTLYEFKNCIFDSGEVAVHSKPNACYDDTKIVFKDCQFINGAYLDYGSVGGFGNCITEISGCSFEKGNALIKGWFSNIRNIDMPESYLSDYNDWQIVGRDNKYAFINLFMNQSSYPKTIRVVADTANVGDVITVEGNAHLILFGDMPYTKLGGNTLPASLISQYRIEDKQAGLAGYTSLEDVFQMWKRLGDCSVNNKTLSVKINGTLAGSYTFNKNYLVSKDSQADIIASINASLNGCHLEGYINMQSWPASINMPNIIKMTNINERDITGLRVIKKDGTIADDTTPANDILGVALTEAAPNDVYYVEIGDAVYAPRTDGVASVSRYGELVTNVANPTIPIGEVIKGALYRDWQW